MSDMPDKPRPEWRALPNSEGMWLYVEITSKYPRLARVYQQEDKTWMVVGGYRQRVRYGRWFPLGPIPAIIDIMGE